MRKLLTLAITLTATLTASAQYMKLAPNYNPDMARQTLTHNKEIRKEIILPQVRGLNIYKADLHTHTIFSDAHVTPEYRVQEAWRDGLDAIAITEHTEYRGYEQTMIDFLSGYLPEGTKAVNTNLLDKGPEQGGIQVDLNLPTRLAENTAARYGIVVVPGMEISRTPEKIGHYNAIFTKDNNTIYHPDCYESFRRAKAQGALIVHNHPGWRRTSMEIGPFEQKAYDEGLIDGIETFNSADLYPQAIDRAKKYGFFMVGATDAHISIARDYLMHTPIRNMTLIFAKDKSLESLRQALLDGNAIAYGYGTLSGEESLLKDLFKASVQTRVERTDANGTRTVAITNTTSISYILRIEGDNPFELSPFTTATVQVPAGEKLLFSVDNMWCGAEEHPVVELDF